MQKVDTINKYLGGKKKSTDLGDSLDLDVEGKGIVKHGY